MITRFATERLDIRPWSDCVPAKLHRDLATMLTPPVLAHLPVAVQDFSKGIPAWIAARDAGSEVLAVSTRSAMIGLLFLFGAPDSDDIHIGYLLSETAWGRGYATELVAGLIEAWPQESAALLRAGVAEDNPASERVLVQAGFERDADAAGDAVSHFMRRVP